jgi:NTP pyrophosphatase (non-canonical NTP hydrolase)
MHPVRIAEIHDIAVSKGFWDGDAGVTPERVIAKLAMVHSEVSEILEAYRKEQGSAKILEEFADTFIRLYDLLVGLADAGVVDSIDIDEVIRLKTQVNSQRPKMHGNLY